MCSAQIEGIAEAPGGTGRVVVKIPGIAQAGQHQPRARILGADGILLPLQPDVGGPQLLLAEAAVSVQLQGDQPARVRGNILLLEVELQHG